jgi:heme/copper-type cytochrome/quinol oxidase subunit 4
MSTKNTVNTKTSDTVRPHIEDGNECSSKANNLIWLMATVTLVASMIEVLAFGPIINTKIYNNSEMVNIIICVVLSAAPILLACVAVMVIDKTRAASSGKAASVITLVVLLAIETGYFWWMFTLRSDVLDDKLLANVFNFVAVMAAVGSLIAHITWSKKRSMLLQATGILRCHTSYNNTGRAQASFQHTSSSDLTRRSHDWHDFISSFKKVVEDVLENMKLSRPACARRYAESDTQARMAQGLPYKVNGQTYSSDEDARKAIGDYIGLPTEADYHRFYGADTNGPIDKRAREAAEEYRARYNDIIRRYPGIDL